MTLVTTENKKDRKENILNAAELLFSQHGFDGVTVRQIANLAGVDVALPNYYFKSKLGLFKGVFLRRAQILNEKRAEMLNAAILEAGDETLALEPIIDAFLRPIQHAQENHDDGWRAYCSLVAMINNSPVWGKELMTDYFDELVEKFIDALKKSLPEADEKDIYWGYHFLSGALTLTMADTGRIDVLSHGLCHSDDVGEAYDRMVIFFAEGLRKITRK